ncbi:MAG: hypothetical protein HYS23_08705 [Geobacter sp.]|nr:hypothetical protein [Geobacter sp.]
MASKVNCDDFRRKKATGLRLLGEVLSKYTECKTPDRFQAAAAMCHKAPNGPLSWGYSLDGLLFEIEKPRHTIPRNASKILNLALSVDVQGKCTNDTDDPFLSLAIDIEVFTNPVPRRCLCAWHLDRHIFKAGDNDPNEVHPLYHFHHGGNRMAHLDGGSGDVLMLDPPRLPHPPMDGILAIDFVLSNYAGGLWRKLRDDGTYKALITESQKALWKPYYESIYLGWKSAPDRKGFNTELVMPTLVLN